MREALFIYGAQTFRGQRHHAHDGRINFGWWCECPGRNIEHTLHFKTVLQHDREPAVGRTVWCSHHPVDHFLLQHESAVDELICKRTQVEEEWGGDVVGEIADGAKVWSQHRKIKLEYVRLVQRQFFFAKPYPQGAGEIAIHLHRVQMVKPVDQRLGDGAGPRAALWMAVILMGVGALLLRPVDQRRREDVQLAPVSVEAVAIA